MCPPVHDRGEKTLDVIALTVLSRLRRVRAGDGDSCSRRMTLLWGDLYDMFVEQSEADAQAAALALALAQAAAQAQAQAMARAMAQAQARAQAQAWARANAAQEAADIDMVEAVVDDILADDEEP